MNPGGSQPQDPLSGADGPAGIDPFERHQADGASNQVDALDDFPDLGDFSAGDADPRLARAFRQPPCQLVEHLRVGMRAGDVVDQADRTGADTDEVVDVHRHAIDSQGIVAAEHFRHQHLGAHAVRAEGETEAAAQFNDVGEIPQVELHRVLQIEMVGRPQVTLDRFQRRVRTPGADAGFIVSGGVRHRILFPE